MNACRVPRKQICARCGDVFFDCEPHDLCPVCELDPDGLLLLLTN